MADDPNPALTAELLAARDALEHELRGLPDLSSTSLSPELRAKLLEVNAARRHRDDLLKATLDVKDQYIAARAALEADGYPTLPKVQIPNSMLSELQEERDDLLAAIAVFEQERAANLTIGLGAPVDKTSRS